MKKIIIIILFFASFIEAPAQKFDLAKTPRWVGTVGTLLHATLVKN